MPAQDHAAQANDEAAPAHPTLAAGALAFDVDGGAVRGVSFAGVEVVRMIDCPIRDADWRTLPVEEIEGEIGPGAGYRRRFSAAGGALEGLVEVDGAAEGAAGRLEARLTLRALRDVTVNRAGLVLLHPIAGVASAPLEVTHSDGRVEATEFPETISPGQPVLDIIGLRHQIGGVEVEIAMEGEVFEMEDQRNWTDASFKTYCRPLALPRPYVIAAGETVRQRIVVTLRAGSDPGEARVAAATAPMSAVAPEIALAHEAALGGVPPAAIAGLAVAGLLLRWDGETGTPATGLARAPMTLEIVTGAEPAEDLRRARAFCAASGVLPTRVVALPRPYLASHQPDGPWPEGPRPMDLVPLLRAAFPEAEVGGGALTNFTEFNRCRPDPDAIDFATFGTTAIVHAADDRSVIETLEALGDVFASARAIAGPRPLRLGLVAIGMRSNPYGAAVADNPALARVPMAMADPRQRTPFAAAFAVAAAAAAARGGVASFAPAMAAGSLGMGEDDALWPIFHAVAALAALGGVAVEVEGGPGAGVVALLGEGKRGVRGIMANLGPGVTEVAAPPGTTIRVLDAAEAPAAARDPVWIEGPGVAAARLEPLAIAILREAP